AAAPHGDGNGGVSSESTVERRGMRAWLGDSSTLLLFQVAATGLATLTFLLIARALGTASFGAFAGVLGLAQAASLFLDAGLGTFLLRELTSGASQVSPSELLYSALRLELRLIGVAVPVVATATLAVTQSGELAAVAALLIAYVGGLTLATSIEALFRSRRNVKRVGVASMIEKTTALSIVATAAATKSGGIVLIAPPALTAPPAPLARDYRLIRRTVVED